jgi:L-threonylcarbamoyladenylate synthase
LETEIVNAREASAIERAVELLRKGETVGLPTETVYGLAADALNPQAVAKIFAAKDRPSFDPLIVHLPDRAWLEKIAVIPPDDRSLIERLLARFWPGPFTIVLPRQEIVPDLVTAGLSTVAVRMSAHPVFDRVVKALGVPLAAPSANRFGRISPTTGQHVLEELDGRIPLVLDGGPSINGLESTVVRVRNGGIQVLRKGPVTTEELSQLGAIKLHSEMEKIVAPGQTPSHYAPSTPLEVVIHASELSLDPNERVGLLAWNSPVTDKGFAEIRFLSPQGDLLEAATRLFALLRELDSAKLDLIIAESVPETGIGAAIMDRLRRASAPR